MQLTRVDISGFRNLIETGFDPHPALNLISGANGAGKSSVLEAIHSLSTAHSFRTRKPRELITHGEDALSVTARIANPADDREHRIGLSRARDGTLTMRVDYEPIDNVAYATRLLPIKALSPDSHVLIQGGPEDRRQFIDWGVFHVEPLFLDSWRVFRRSLSQRNQALRDYRPDDEVRSWNEQLSCSATAVDAFRRRYVDELADALRIRLDQLDAPLDIALRYRSGWSDDISLADALSQNLELHRRMKTTTDGPHRADLLITIATYPVKQVLSRGQQKTLVYLLHLSQLDLLDTRGARRAVVLCDDLPSELDDVSADNVVTQLLGCRSQVFISGVLLNSLTHHAHALFHVEHGVVGTN